MSKQRHIIREQEILLTVSDQETGIRLQQEVSRIVQPRLLPIIERYCDELAGPDTLVRLDTVQVNLEEINLNRFSLDLEEKLRRQLKPALEQAIREEEASGKKQQERKTESQLELLSAFLEKGALPWWADSHDPVLISKAIQKLVKVQPKALQGLLRGSLPKESRFRRLIHQIKERDLLLLAQSFDKSLSAILDNLLHDLTEIRKVIPGWRGKTKTEFYRETWRAIFSTLVYDIPKGKKEVFLARQVWLHLATRFRVPQEQWPSILKNIKKRKKTFGSKIVNAVEEMVTFEWKEPAEREKNQNVEAFSEGDQDFVPKEKKLDKLEDRHITSHEEVPFHEERVQDTEEIFIDNAGLVILWPFLPRLFENLGLTQDKAFVDEAAPHKAIHLLQYLATGETGAPEYDLPLNKILCGLVVDALYEPDLGVLTAAERVQADELLEAVVQQAEGLGKISVEGFRNSFLRRNGLLSVEDGHWLLRVEKESYDLLLDRIWGFRIVKLPWMAFPMYVDW